MSHQPVINIAIFASGTGTNAKKIIETLHFNKEKKAIVKLIVCNNPEAGVLAIAKNAGIETLLIERDRFFKGDAYLPEFEQKQIDLIVLAGFLWKIPAALIQAYPERIINIHPALLPDYGGKGMYGHFVHQAVIDAKEKQSGITIHYVDELYDHGKIIFQATCAVDEKETAGSLANKIHLLEHLHYPRVVEELVQMQNHR